MSFSGTSTSVSVRPAIGDVIPALLTSVGALGLLLGVSLVVSACDSTSSSLAEDVVGTLATSVSTSGEMLDPDGYTLTVDDTSSEEVDPDGTALFPNLSRGGHEVALAGIASNCSVDGTNPRAVTVLPDDTSSVAFDVTCQSTTGAIAVSATTSGADEDTDGYTVTVDGNDSADIGPEGSTTFTDLSEGNYEVELSGIKSNCSPEGANPRTATVVAQETASVEFQVACESTTGAIEVFASTSGDRPDQNGYTVTVDGTESASIAPDGRVTFTGLEEDVLDVELSGIKTNCSPQGDNPRSVEVTAPDTATVSFDITCSMALVDAVVFESNRSGEPNIHVIDADGTHESQVTTNGGRGPAVSPDGSRIAFHSNSDGDDEIYTVNPDGSGLTQVTDGTSTDQFPSWSPAGDRLAYQSDRTENFNIQTINPDGTDRARVTDNGAKNPVWSPDGSHIAFQTRRDGDWDIYKVHVDTLGTARVTEVSSVDSWPNWSPASRIAFDTDRDGNSEVYTINPDGSSLTRVTNHSATDRFPSWSPDVSRIAFTTDRDGNDEIYTINPDGSGLIRLTNHPDGDRHPDWGPSP